MNLPPFSPDAAQGRYDARSIVSAADTPAAPLQNFVENLNALLDAGLQSSSPERPRTYLGASQLGDSCARRIQYRYTAIPTDTSLDARTLRIFAAGHAYETLGVAWIRAAGFNLETRNERGCPFGFATAGGRIRGHVDGIIKDGPSILDYPCLWEFKSMNAKNWKDCVRRGVAVSKPIYYGQIQLYMAYMGLTQSPCLLTCINKDTQELWHEQVPFDASAAQHLSDRGVQILKATDAGETLPRIANDPTYYECKMCPYAKRCWNER
jgi:hypothetical protein